MGLCAPPVGMCTRIHGRAAARAGVDLSGCHGVEPQRVPCAIGMRAPMVAARIA